MMIFILVVLIKHLVFSSAFDGTWVKTGGDYIPLYETFELTFKCDSPGCEKKADLTHQYGSVGEEGYTTTWFLDASKSSVKQKIPSRFFPSNPFMGLRFDEGDIITFWFPKQPTETEYQVQEEKVIYGSQGPFNLSILHSFTVDGSSSKMSYTMKRNSREAPITFELTKKELLVFTKKTKKRLSENMMSRKPDFSTSNGVKAMTNDLPYNPNLPTSYFIKIGYDYDWTLSGTVDEKILLISMAGLVNKDTSQLYLLYPQNFTFALTHEIFNFLATYTYNFVELKNIEEVLSKFSSSLLPSSYVVFDPSVRTSVITSFTAASLNQSVVVSERLIPLIEKHGITRKLYDFRAVFRGKTDYEIYTWALDHLWIDGITNTEFVTWLGGECHGEIVPSIADFGMTRSTFYTDLDTKRGTKEFPLADKLMSRLNKPRVLGWHSYCKDLERDYTTLTSNHGGRVHGLNSFPNLSFGKNAPLTKGFVFKNTHSKDPGQPLDKVYLGAIQTDGIGMGAWNKPGRGQIPYTWEVTMDDLELFPTMLEMFYRNLTKNDFLCAGLSSPAYMYPKAAPKEDLQKILQLSNQLFKVLDINVMAVMDYSEGSTVTGNTDLTKEVVDMYFSEMPQSIGFTNGYSPSFTFAVSDSKVPFLSYDYYLDPNVSPNDVIHDLRELGTINSIRPYFLVVHVREYSDEKRVKQIFDALGKDYELLPVDKLVKLAGRKFTSKVRYEHDK